jgi:hypothetical protein
MESRQGPQGKHLKACELGTKFMAYIFCDQFTSYDSMHKINEILPTSVECINTSMKASRKRRPASRTLCLLSPSRSMIVGTSWLKCNLKCSPEMVVADVKA